MRLADLLAGFPRYELLGDGDADVRLIELDSRRVGGGEMFVCLEGLARNGHDFAAAAKSEGWMMYEEKKPTFDPPPSEEDEERLRVGRLLAGIRTKREYTIIYTAIGVIVIDGLIVKGNWMSVVGGFAAMILGYQFIKRTIFLKTEAEKEWEAERVRANSGTEEEG